jgi:hypothetical protein
MNSGVGNILYSYIYIYMSCQVVVDINICTHTCHVADKVPYSGLMYFLYMYTVVALHECSGKEELLTGRIPESFSISISRYTYNITTYSINDCYHCLFQ